VAVEQVAQPELYPETLLDEVAAAESPEETTERVWWALYTRARQEKALARDLWALRVPFYLPLVNKKAYYRNRPVSSSLPIFANYVFLYGSEEDRVTSLKTNRVSRVLRAPDPSALRRDLIHLRRLIASGEPLTVESRWRPGQRVRIRYGLLAGLEGTILKRRGQTRLFVAVDFLQRGASVAIDDFLLEPISGQAVEKSAVIEFL
jgi:hypothetical protein